MPLADLRREYTLGGLRRADLDANPVVQFQKWFGQAEAALAGKQLDANAVTLATADKNGFPSARIVLLKGLSEHGFTFFTNYDSRKGRELAENPHAALNFFWPELERQIAVAGSVQKTSPENSRAYFQSRPRASQLSAWTSRQSSVVPDRAALETEWQKLEEKYPAEIPLPPDWGGFILQPERIEFWQGRPGRLHDRFRYTRQADHAWKIERIAP